jgi:DNA repair protein RadC
MQNPSCFHEAPLPPFAHRDAVETHVGMFADRVHCHLTDSRRRRRSRFMGGGAAALPDDELLELILFRAMPRQDVKPLAHRMLKTLGDFNRVLATEPVQLLDVNAALPMIPAGVDVVTLPADSRVYYDAMIAAFAQGVVDRLK